MGTELMISIARYKILHFFIRIDWLELEGQRFVRIRLSDNGVGYSEEALQQLQRTLI